MPGPLQGDKPRFRSIDQCSHCRRLDLDGNRCAAFPAGIPGEIRLGRVDHALPYPGDHGVRFAPRPPETTAGAVQYVRILEPAAPRAKTIGAIWIADDGTVSFEQAMGFLPVRGAEDARRFWHRQLRNAWRQDQRPQEVFDRWSSGETSYGWSVGPVERLAGGLDELARRIGADRPRLPARRRA